MEYKAGNHPSPTVSIQDNDRFRLQPYSVRLWRWVDNSLLSESCMCLQNLFSVRLNFSKCWFLAGSPHQIIVSHPALVNVKRSNVICDVNAAAPRSTSLSPAKRAFFLFLALNAPSPLPPHAWNTQTIKPVADSVNLPCSCGTKVWVVGVLFEHSSQRLRKSEFIG